MAYNPFSALRRYKQTGLVALTIMCMFIFVLSSGIQGGDIFDQMSRSIGARGNRNIVGSLNGSPVDSQQVQQTMQRRKIANIYMSNAVAMASNEIITNVRTRTAKLDAADREPIEAYFQERQFIGNLLQRSPQLAQNQQFMAQFMGQERRAKDRIRQMALGINREEKKDLAKVLDQLVKVFDAEAQRSQLQGAYFGGSPGSPTDALQFMAWLQHADQLGIRLTQDDVKREIAHATLGGLTNTIARDIEKGLNARFAHVTPSNLLGALADEFRVRLAQVALAGISDNELIAQLIASNRGFMEGPQAKAVVHTNAHAFAPYDAWKFFKENRTQITLTVLPVDAESFLPQVTAQPSDEDLKKLYEAGKNLESIPGEEAIGFKRVRQAKLEFTGIQPNLPYYRKLVMLARRLHPLTGIGHALQGDWLTAEMADRFISARDRNLSWEDQFMIELFSTSYWHPEPLAAMVAESVSFAALGNPLMALTTGNQGHARSLESRHRARVGTTLLAGLAPTGNLGTLGLPFAVRPQPLPISAFTAQIEARLSDQAAINLLDADLKAFAAKVEELGKKADKAEVRKYLDEFAQTRGIKLVSSGLVTHQTLPDDPALAPLRERFVDFEAVSAHSQSPVRRKPSDMYRNFFTGPGSSEKSPPLYVPTNFPLPNQVPSVSFPPSHTYYLVWKTEEIEPKQILFDEAKPNVLAAWKLQEARRLAKAEAEELAKTAKSLKGNVQELRDLAAKKKLVPFDLGPMAKMNPQPQTLPGMPRQYMRYQIPTDKIEYPPLSDGELTTTLFSVQDKPEGEAVVTFTDRPKRFHYVAVRTFRSEPSQSEFGDALRGFAPQAALADSFLKNFDAEQTFLFRTNLTKQLQTLVKLEIDEKKLAEMEQNTRE